MFAACEAQAIASKEIDLVEEILQQKDDCIADIASQGNATKSDPRDKPSVDTLIDKVVELQQRNFSTFSSLVSKQRSRNKETSHFQK